jgi:signal transduction histidine kinase
MRGDVIREEIYIGIYSVMTWVSYSFALPAALVMGFYFYGLNNTNPKLLTKIKTVVWIPAVILSFFFHPINFDTYQQSSQLFWNVYSIYNVGIGVIVLTLIWKGVRIEKSAEVKRQKILLGAVVMPATIYVLVTVFIFHTLGLTELFKAWQWNIVIIIVSFIAAMVMAFRNGFLGLKLSVRTYDWHTDMSLIGKGADYTNHMLKNQTAKMEMCIEQLKLQHDGGELPEELEILSRSISALKNYIDRMKRHSQAIHLIQEPCGVAGLLTEAASMSLIDVGENVFLVCDKSHMTEVFSNIFINAAEAISENGTIDISGEYSKSSYCLRIKDDGAGMDDDTLKEMFSPYFTTKNTERNFGLGLSYCKNVIEKHGGSISGKRNSGNGTTVTISLPSKRVATCE